MDLEAAERALHRIKQLGSTIAIDDFGTGYSSLSRLKHFPVDFLKIDRSFVSGITSELQDEVLASAVLGVADSLGLRVIAEGVEDQLQLAKLRQLGCNVGQGFIWSPAVRATAAIELSSFGPAPAP